MRRASLLAVAAVVWSAVAIAGPRTPTKAEQAELQALEKQLVELQQKQAPYRGGQGRDARSTTCGASARLQTTSLGDPAPQAGPRAAAVRRDRRLTPRRASASTASCSRPPSRRTAPESREVLWALMPLDRHGLGAQPDSTTLAARPAAAARGQTDEEARRREVSTGYASQLLDQYAHAAQHAQRVLVGAARCTSRRYKIQEALREDEGRA